MTQRELHHRCPSQHGFTKAGNLEQTAGSSTGYRVSFPRDLVDLNLFQATGLSAESSLQHK